MCVCEYVVRVCMCVCVEYVVCVYACVYVERVYVCVCMRVCV